MTSPEKKLFHRSIILKKIGNVGDKRLVLIKKSSGDRYWYEKFVGQTMYVREFVDREDCMKNGFSYSSNEAIFKYMELHYLAISVNDFNFKSSHYILKEDCEIIK